MKFKYHDQLVFQVRVLTLHHPSLTHLPSFCGYCDAVRECLTDASPPNAHRFYTNLSTDILVKRVANLQCLVCLPPQARAREEGGEKRDGGTSCC